MRQWHKNTDAGVETGVYTMRLDPATGLVVSLQSRTSATEWIARCEGAAFGRPFVAGTQMQETPVPMAGAFLGDGSWRAVSPSGATELRYTFAEDGFSIDATLPRRTGPRTGLTLDLNHLDLATGTPWAEQLTPVVIHVAEDTSYAYFIWHRAEHEHLVMAVDGPFAAWRLRYSYWGHRMTGFQLLSLADDVLDEGDARLRRVESLRIHVAFAGTVAQAMERARTLLGLAMAVPELTGVPVGGDMPIRIVGSPCAVRHILPDGAETPLAVTDAAARPVFGQPGIHRIEAVSANGRVHATRILCHDDWKTLFARCASFHAKHFQHECGAFFRAIDNVTLKPDRLTLEGLSYGDPFCPSSCRTGEFGGFAGWLLLKTMMLFGHDERLMHAVDRYIRNWALNLGHEAEPYLSTVCRAEQDHNERHFSAYHLYKEINYPQYEIFLLWQLIDYVRLTGAEDILAEAVALARHFIGDHVRSDGMVMNSARAHDHDYTTVDAPSAAITELGLLLRDYGRPEAEECLAAARRIADYCLRRGLDFPTEGEACTEDGSFACAAWTLLHAYRHLEAKPEYLEMGRRMVLLHEKLMLRGLDCRMNRSSLRFWETLYETESWGASINAGHGWTQWTTAAKMLLFEITGETRWALEAYESFVAGLCNIDLNGGIHTCHTPDMIPSAPHVPYMWSDCPDAIAVSSVRAMRQPPSYAASGTYVLIRAATAWAQASAIRTETRCAANGRFDRNGVFHSMAPQFSRLAVSSLTAEPLVIAATAGQELTISFDHATQATVDGADIVSQGERMLRMRPRSATVTLRRRA